MSSSAEDNSRMARLTWKPGGATIGSTASTIGSQKLTTDCISTTPKKSITVYSHVETVTSWKRGTCFQIGSA